MLFSSYPLNNGLHRIFCRAALCGRPSRAKRSTTGGHRGPPLQSTFTACSCPWRPSTSPCSNRLYGLSCRASCLSCRVSSCRLLSGPCRTILHNNRSTHDRLRDSCLSYSSCMNHLCSNQASLLCRRMRLSLPRRLLLSDTNHRCNNNTTPSHNRHQPSFGRLATGSGPCPLQTQTAAVQGA